MGLINNANYISANGVQKVGTYISFNSETLYLSKQVSGSVDDSVSPVINYSVHANYRIFWDKQARDDNKTFMELKTVQTNITEAELNNSLYTILYDKLRTIYPSAIDEI